ncbi:MAG: hypothetical protein FWE02_03735 [Defluviitaleaceae bacterium]|nr:hypothetical protein [Defluviitaleaceae bacterium]
MQYRFKKKKKKKEIDPKLIIDFMSFLWAHKSHWFYSKEFILELEVDAILDNFKRNFYDDDVHKNYLEQQQTIKE